MTATTAKRVFGYLRVSTEEQATTGHGLAAQRATIAAEAQRRGWIVEWITDDGYSGKNLRRPGIERALAVLAQRRRRPMDGLVVAKLDRLTRSVRDFAGLMDQAHRERWALVALDLNVDTTTPAGELLANVMATVNQFERKIIGQRTREGLAAAKAKGQRLGNPQRIAARSPAKVRARILKLRADGVGYQSIATTLNTAKVPTAFGGARWYASSVRAVALRVA